MQEKQKCGNLAVLNKPEIFEILIQSKIYFE